MSFPRLGQKFDDGSRLLRHDRRAADDIAAHARLLFLRDEPLHARLAVHVRSVKMSNGARGLPGQLFREHMGMNIRNSHLLYRPKPYKIA